MADLLSTPAPDAPHILDAASILLVDQSAAAPRLLMGLRRADHVFLPNKWVFPGGRLEASDAAITPATPLHPADAVALEHGAAPESHGTLANALAVAAVRELFEETGCALAEPFRGGSIPSDVWPAFRELNLMPSLAALRFIARAITPPGRPRRYDTRFFIADRQAAIEGAGPIDGEFSQIGWMGLDEARALDLPLITRRVLADLEFILFSSDGTVSGPVPFYYQDSDRYRRDLIPRT